MGRDKKPIFKGEAHIRIPLAVLNSNAFIALDWTARALYTDMRSYLRSINNGNLNATLSELQHRGWRSPATLAKALRQLEAVGLIAKTRQTVGVKHGSKVCNLYRFTDLDTLEFPKLQIQATRATHDYQRLTSLGEAKRAVAKASPPTPNKEKKTLQKLHPDDSKGVAITGISATKTVVAPLSLCTKSVAMEDVSITSEPNSHKGFSHSLGR